MLRRLYSPADITRLWPFQPVCRSVRGTRPWAPAATSQDRHWFVPGKPVEIEKRLLFSDKLAVPRCRQGQASQGFESRLFSMTGENSSTDGVQEPSTEKDVSEIDKYSDYRGLAILKFIGFEITELTGTKSTGRFVVSKNSCQPFNVLHGGTTAYIAESIASVSAVLASEFQRVAGIELTCSHLRSVPIGSEVEVSAVPLRLGKRIQVWEVKFETVKTEKPGISESSESGVSRESSEKLEISESRVSSESSGPSSKLVLAAVCRVTLIVGLPLNPESKL